MSKFATGHSGNPAGRKRGIPNKTTAEARRILESSTPNVLRATIESALNGDSTAQRIILGLALPKRVRPVLELPRLDSVEAVTASLATLVEQAARGDIEPEEARALAAVVDAAGKHLGAELRMTKFFDTVMETILEESPETAQRITERLATLQKLPAETL